MCGRVTSTQATKIKFDYAVVSADDLRKQINPTDAQLQSYFTQNAAKYAQAVPETRKIEYLTLGANAVPSGTPAVSDAEAQQYYQQHADEFKVEDSVRVRAHPDQGGCSRGRGGRCGGQGEGPGHSRPAAQGRGLRQAGQGELG